MEPPRASQTLVQIVASRTRLQRWKARPVSWEYKLLRSVRGWSRTEASPFSCYRRYRKWKL